MLHGDIGSAFSSATSFLQCCFMSGHNLVTLGKDVKLFRKRAMEYRQKSTYEFNSIIEEAVSKLIHFSGHQSSEAGILVDQKILVQLCLRENNFRYACYSYILLGMVEYIFGNYELAAEMLQKRWDMEKKTSKMPGYRGLATFYECLICVAMARKQEKDKWVSRAGTARSKLEEFSKYGEINYENKCLLLQAEMFDVEGHSENASNMYDAAIAAAERNDFIHEQAIANERAGDFYQRHGDSKSYHYYGKAHDLYRQWGAFGKVEHLYKSTPS